MFVCGNPDAVPLQDCTYLKYIHFSLILEEIVSTVLKSKTHTKTLYCKFATDEIILTYVDGNRHQLGNLCEYTGIN